MRVLGRVPYLLVTQCGRLPIRAPQSGALVEGAPEHVACQPLQSGASKALQRCEHLQLHDALCADAMVLLQHAKVVVDPHSKLEDAPVAEQRQQRRRWPAPGGGPSAEGVGAKQHAVAADGELQQRNGPAGYPLSIHPHHRVQPAAPAGLRRRLVPRPLGWRREAVPQAAQHGRERPLRAIQLVHCREEIHTRPRREGVWQARCPCGF